VESEKMKEEHETVYVANQLITTLTYYNSVISNDSDKCRNTADLMAIKVDEFKDRLVSIRNRANNKKEV
jgi:hypothetical protein